MLGTKSPRVYGLSVKATSCTAAPAEWVFVLWSALDMAAMAAAVASNGTTSTPQKESTPDCTCTRPLPPLLDTSSSCTLVASKTRSKPNSPVDVDCGISRLHLDFNADLSGNHINASIIDRLALMEYAALMACLTVLYMEGNEWDISATDLAALSLSAPYLRDISFRRCGLTSVAGFHGQACTHFQHLTKIDLFCCQQLHSLEGLEHHLSLEDVNASQTAIVSLQPLRSCIALKHLNLSGCRHITSLEGLQQLVHLETLDASRTAVATLEPLRTCPALRSVCLSYCQRLASLDGLEDHRVLEVVDASNTFIETLRPLHTCLALRRLCLSDCYQLTTLVEENGEGLHRGHVALQEMILCGTPIMSLKELLLSLDDYSALRSVDVRRCTYIQDTAKDLATFSFLKMK